MPRSKGKKRAKPAGPQEYSRLVELLNDRHVRAIVFSLTEEQEIKGVRYNQLYRNSNNLLHESKEKEMSIKTFNDHLKELVKLDFVERIERSRYEVRYRWRFFDETKSYWAKQVERDIQLFRKAAEEIWALLQKARLSDEEVAKNYISYSVNFLDLIVLRCLYLGVKLYDGENWPQISFLLNNTMLQIIDHVALAIHYLSEEQAESEKYLAGFLEKADKTYESALEKFSNQRATHRKVNVRM